LGLKPRHLKTFRESEFAEKKKKHAQTQDRVRRTGDQINYEITTEHDVFHGNFMEYFTRNLTDSPWKFSRVFFRTEFREVSL